MSVGDLYAAADALLGAASQACVLAPGGAMDRVFVSPGVPAWDCVAAGSMVATTRGPVPIEEVRPGDRAWAWDDDRLRSCPVTALIPKGTQATLRVRTRRRTLHVTPAHLMLVLRLVGTRPGGRSRNNWRLEWVAAGELRRGDYLVVADRLPSAAGAGPVPPDVAWLLGLITADGSLRRDGAEICVYNGVATKAQEVLRRVWGASCSTDRKHGIVAYSPELRRQLGEFGLQRRSPERTVPPEILASDHETIRAFLRGYADGDGHRTPLGVQYAAASPRLVAEVRALHLAIGDVVSNIDVRERPVGHAIRGNVVAEAKPLHRFLAHPEHGSQRRNALVLERRGARRVLPDERFVVDRVALIEDGGERDLYDISVHGAENFVADGFVVHNCPNQLTVHIGAAVEADTAPLQPTLQPMHRITDGRLLNLVTMTLTALRCVPNPDDSGQAPDPAAMDAAAAVTIGDVWAIWNHLATLKRNLTLFPPRERELMFDPAIPVVQQGGIGGWQIQVRVQVDGFRTV